MRLIKHLLFLCFLAGLTACSEEAFVPQPDEVPSVMANSIKSINIVVPEMQFNASTRSNLIENNEKLYFKWEEGDAAGVFPLVGSQVKFPVMEESVGSSSALFDGGQWALRADGKYAAYFPYDINNEGIEAVAIDYTGQTQENFDEYDFMGTGAISPTNGEITFNMKRISAILKIEIAMDANTYGRFGRLYVSPEKVGVKGVMDLSGTVPVFVPSEYSNYIETDLLKDEMFTEEADTLKAYMLIPPVDMTDKTIVFRISSNKSDDVYEAEIEGKNFEAGKAYKLVGKAKLGTIRNLNLIAAAETNQGVNFVKNDDGTINIKENLEELAKVTKINVYNLKDSTICDEIGFFPNLSELDCRQNKLTSLDVSKNTLLTKLECGWNELTTLDVSNNVELTSINCYRNYLTTLDVSRNTALTSLICDENQLTSLDVTRNTDLLNLSLNRNQLTTLDISKNKALRGLLFEYNNLSEVDISNNLLLNQLVCTGNQISSIDLSRNVEMQSLTVSSNKLTSLDVSNNPKITMLLCDINQLTSLDVSKLTKLNWFGCSGNLLTSLDISQNTAMTTLNCSRNQLTFLDISHNITLQNLECYENQITSLDVSNCTTLKKLLCWSNPLTTLDVSNCTALNTLYCYDDQLTSLNLTGCTALQFLYCYSNYLTSLTIPSNIATYGQVLCHDNLMSELDITNITILLNNVYCGNQWTDRNKNTAKPLTLYITATQERNGRLQNTDAENKNVSLSVQ